MIDWVRHGESCENLYSGSYKDKDTSLLSLLQDAKNKLHYMGYDNHPPLSMIGIKHAITLGEKFTSKQNYDYVLITPTTRALMTALFAFAHNPSIKIYVVPFLKKSRPGKNKSLPLHVLREIHKYLVNWIKSNEFFGRKYTNLPNVIFEKYKMCTGDSCTELMLDNFESLLDRSKNIAIVSHNGTMKKYFLDKINENLKDKVNNLRNCDVIRENNDNYELIYEAEFERKHTVCSDYICRKDSLSGELNKIFDKNITKPISNIYGGYKYYKKRYLEK